jgi:hypothetical protein
VIQILLGHHDLLRAGNDQPAWREPAYDEPVEDEEIDEVEEEKQAEDMREEFPEGGLPCAETRQSSAEATVDPMNRSPSGTPSKIDIRLSFSDFGGTIARISLGKCRKNVRGLNRSKTSKYVEATADSNAPSRTMRIVSN